MVGPGMDHLALEGVTPLNPLSPQHLSREKIQIQMRIIAQVQHLHWDILHFFILDRSPLMAVVISVEKMYFLGGEVEANANMQLIEVNGHYDVFF